MGRVLLTCCLLFWYIARDIFSRQCGLEPVWGSGDLEKTNLTLTEESQSADNKAGMFQRIAEGLEDSLLNSMNDVFQTRKNLDLVQRTQEHTQELLDHCTNAYGRSLNQLKEMEMEIGDLVEEVHEKNNQLQNCMDNLDEYSGSVPAEQGPMFKSVGTQLYWDSGDAQKMLIALLSCLLVLSILCIVWLYCSQKRSSNSKSHRSDSTDSNTPE